MLRTSIQCFVSDPSDTLKRSFLGLEYSKLQFSLLASYVYKDKEAKKTGQGQKEKYVSALKLNSRIHVRVSHYQTGGDKDGCSIQAE